MTDLIKVERSTEVAETTDQMVGRVKQHIEVIQKILRGVMINGTHYGTVPGCGNKPVLLKPGAEKILSTFRIAVDLVVEDLSTDDCCRYRVTAKGISPDGHFLGAGIGEASTNEEKYKWQSCSEAEYEHADVDRIRSKFDRNGNESFQIRTNPFDKANTVLKMAKKRALVDLCLTVTAASDIFEQDLEEDEFDGQKPAPSKPSGKRNATGGLEAVIEIGNIQDVKGEKNGKPWTRYEIASADGRHLFKTFSESHATTAYNLREDGKKARVIYKSGKFGLDLEHIEEATQSSKPANDPTMFPEE